MCQMPRVSTALHSLHEMESEAAQQTTKSSVDLTPLSHDVLERDARLLGYKGKHQVAHSALTLFLKYCTTAIGKRRFCRRRWSAQCC
jgi:hypothetical protein